MEIDPGISDSCREESAPCDDCGTETKGEEPWEYYMVWDEVWAQAGMPEHRGYLCVGCLEARLGRTLTASDFKEPAAINHPDGPWHSVRLASRLRAES